jgi:hypothetical protein
MARFGFLGVLCLHVFAVAAWPSDICGDAHYVAQGRTSWPGWEWYEDVPDYYCQFDDLDQALYYSKRFDYDIGVGCCPQDGVTAHSHGYRPDCDSHPATYQEAVDLCEENGYRLCTVEESQNGATHGVGCKYDRLYQWTSDSCHMASSGGSVYQQMTADVMESESASDAVVVLTAKDLVVLALLGVTLVLVTALIVICIQRSRRCTKYAPVGVVSDSEMEKFGN